MAKYFTQVYRIFFLVSGLCLIVQYSYATAWTTGVHNGAVTNLLSWTNGISTPTSFATPGDTWAITDSMTMSSSATWTVGTVAMSAVTVTFAAGGDLTVNGGAAAPVINIYGNLIGSGGTYNVNGGAATPVINVYGNTNIGSGAFITSGGSAHFTYNSHGSFIMSGGTITVFGGGCDNRINIYGNCSLSGTSAFVSSGGGATGSVHFGLASAVMSIDNTSTGAWGAMDVFVDIGCTAQLDGNFTTTTGTIANGLTVNGRLICPATTSVNGTNSFTVNSRGTLIVGHATGINGAILTTGPKTFNDTASYGFNGVVAQVTGTYLPAVLYAPDTIIINNVAGVALTQSTATTGLLAFESGILSTGANTLTIPGAAANVTGAGASSYVNGTLVKTITGFTAINYEVGDMSYAPMMLTLNAAGTGGSLALKASNGLHPSVSTSTLSSTHIYNHYWTITSNSAAGPATVVPKATCNLADILGSSNTYFVTQEFSGSAWLGAPLASTNTSSPYATAPNTGIALATLPGDYIFGRVAGTLDVKAATATTELKVFPNPNSGTFNMNLVSGNNEEVHVVITNIVGEKVQEITTTTNKVIDIAIDAKAGIYLLSAYTAHDSYTLQVVVK